MSRNDTRLGVQDVNLGDSPAPAVAVGPELDSNNNSTAFKWTCPTEIVDLPSEGQFYPEGHPLQGKTTVEINFMTAKEEDILASKALLRKGVAIDRMLESLIADKRIKASDLLLGDKNALTVAARITGYGADYDTKVTCPYCGNGTEHTFDLAEVGHKDPSLAISEHEVEVTPRRTFIFEMPMTKVKVECRLMTGADEQALMKSAQRKQKHKLNSSALLEQFRTFVVSVDGDSSVDTLASFITNMPARDSRHLRKVYGSITPNVDMTQLFECDECGEESALEIPLTAEFFWPQ